MLSQGALLHSCDNPWPLEKETYGLLDLEWGGGKGQGGGRDRLANTNSPPHSPKSNHWLVLEH